MERVTVNVNTGDSRNHSTRDIAALYVPSIFINNAYFNGEYLSGFPGFPDFFKCRRFFTSLSIPVGLTGDRNDGSNQWRATFMDVSSHLYRDDCYIHILGFKTNNTKGEMNMSSNDYLLETKGLTKSYKGKDVVRDLHLKLQEGEIYGFLGPNGAGKTTTIRMLLGLIRPTEGGISVFGKNLTTARISILQDVGSLVEAPSYYPHLSGTDNLETIRKIIQAPKERIEEVLDLVRLSKMADRQVKEYSLGMKQRLGLAAALLGRPRLLILDEPTNGLDPAGMIEIRELIQELPKKYGITTLVSSHLLSEIDQIATKVGIITNGEMIFQDDINVLREKASRKIHILTNDNDQAQAMITAEGIAVTQEEHHLSLDDQPNETIASIVKQLVHADIRVYRITEENASLEDIFLEVTKEGQTL